MITIFADQNKIITPQKRCCINPLPEQKPWATTNQVLEFTKVLPHGASQENGG
jgi:hypothetical protein